MNIAKTIQLQGYNLLRLHVDWHGTIGSSSSIPAQMGISSGIETHPDQPEIYRITLDFNVTYSDAAGEPIGHEIDATVVGVFRIHSDSPGVSLDKAYQLEASVVLYNILRGQVYMLLGSFPDERFFLPDLDVDGIIEHMQETQKPEQKARSARKKTTKKLKAKRRTAKRTVKK